MNNEFCKECNNLLYPREDNQEKTLFLACKSCDHIQEATSNRLYSKTFRSRHTSLERYAKDLIQDPTLPSITINCKNCGFNKGLYFQSRENDEDVALSIFYLCHKCHHLWT